MAAILTGLSGIVKNLGSSATKQGMNAFKDMTNSIGQQVTSFMSGQSAMQGLASVFGDLMNALNPFTPVLQTLSDIFSVFGDIIAAKMAPVMEKLFKILLSPSVLALVEKLGDVFVKLFDAFMPIIDILVKTLVPVLDIVLDAFSVLAGIIKWTMDTVLTPLINFIVGIVMGALTGLANAFNFIVNVFKGVINAIIWVINAFINILNKIVEVVTLGFVKNAIPNVPSLGSGGDIEGSGIARVHKNEKVLNPAETELYRALVDNSSTSNIGGDIMVVLNNSGSIGVDDIADSIADKVGERLARKGFDFRR